MVTALDTAISAAQAAEATYLADSANVVTIQAAIDAATSPLAPAKALAITDAAAFNATLDAVSAAALAAKIALPAPA